MTEMGNLLANVITATEREVEKKEIEKGMASGITPPGQDIKLLLTKWDEFIRYLIHVGGARSEDELRNVRMYDFMVWLKGQNV